MVLVGVALLSTAGWAASLAFSRSAARRHLILLATLIACLMLPVAAAIRGGTDWRVLVLQRSADVEATVTRSEWERSAQLRQADQSERRGVNVTTPAPPHAQDSSTQIRERASTAPKSAASVAATASPRPIHQTSTPRQAESATVPLDSTWNSPNLGNVAWALYGLVAAVMVVRLLASLIAIGRLRRSAKIVETISGDVEVLEADVAVPMAIGFGRSTIMLPRGFRDAVESDELRDVMAHEMEHLHRGDHWWVLLQAIAAAAYWPILPVHGLNRAFTRAREELCDNAVLVCRDPVAYGQTLLSVAQHASQRPIFGSQLATTIIERGELERRVAGLLDDQRDRRTSTGHPARWTIAIGLTSLLVLAATTRVVAVAPGQTADEKTDQTTEATAEPENEIAWTETPTVDPANPTVHRGIVLGPDGQPLAGASIYAASTIEILELADADKVGAGNLGEVRAVTDSKGRFEFSAHDLSWVTTAGQRKRWETLLVATKEGVAPGWLKTWGADRSFRSHWHPWKGREVALRMRPPETLSGQVLLTGGAPLAGARLRLTGLMAPRDFDLETHIEKEEKPELGMFSSIDYGESLYRPAVLPGLKTEATTDENGRFEMPGLPEGFIARLEITHRDAVTTSLRVAVRPIESVYREPFAGRGEPSLTLYGSEFTTELPEGMVLRGRVRSNRIPRAGVTVALANHNAKSGMYGQRFQTDEEGRFEVTGLRPKAEGYDLAFVGSFAMPLESRRQRVVNGEDARVELPLAVPYRLKLVDPDGHPVDRQVYSIEVQEAPGSSRRDVKRRFNDAERVAAGIYQGIVPQGPGAVMVKRGVKSDRPASVDPKEFFAPGRKDWTSEEQRYAYGDAWRIAQPSVLSNSRRAADQLEHAAIVLTNARSKDGVLQLTATVFRDPPVQITLVDEAGKPVVGARLRRQLKRYDEKELPATFSAYGLHTERDEFLEFQHDERGLIGTLLTTWTDQPVRVVMRPAATLLGRFTKQSGELDRDFGVRIVSDSVMPDTFIAGRVFKTTAERGKGKGEFRLVLPPDVELRGEFVRKTSDRFWRPSAGVAFDGMMLEPGQTLDLGNLIVP